MRKDPRELFGLLTSRIQHFALAPGGNQHITAFDISQILATIHNEGAILYARVKYCEQHNFAEDLTEKMRVKSLLIHGIEKRKIPRPDWILDMCRMALIEAIKENICHQCFGVGEIIPENAPRIICSECNGYGRSIWKDNDRARLLGISKQSYSSSWAKLYKEIIHVTISTYEDLITGALRKNLSV